MTKYRVFLLRPTSYSEIFALMADALAHFRKYIVVPVCYDYLPKQISYSNRPVLSAIHA